MTMLRLLTLVFLFGAAPAVAADVQWDVAADTDAPVVSRGDTVTLAARTVKSALKCADCDHVVQSEGDGAVLVNVLTDTPQLKYVADGDSLVARETGRMMERNIWCSAVRFEGEKAILTRYDDGEQEEFDRAKVTIHSAKRREGQQ